MTLRGVFPAMVTPYVEGGGIDVDGLDSLAEFLIGRGVHGLHPCGTTGEAPLLSLDERKLVATTVISAAGGRVPVIVQVGHMHAASAAELALHAAESGANAISVVTPYYYSLPERALLDYFRGVVAAVPEELPVYLYNIPQCTTNPVPPGVLERLMADHSNVKGIKHSQDDLVRLSQYLSATQGKAQVFVGSDGVILPGLSLGAYGVVSGNANAIPDVIVGLYDAFRSGDLDRARLLQRHVSHIAALLGNGGSLASFKEFVARRGVAIENHVREPLAGLSEEESGRVDAAMDYARKAGLFED